MKRAGKSSWVAVAAMLATPARLSPKAVLR